MTIIKTTPKRGNGISFKLSDDEIKAWRSAAAAGNFSLSDWIRRTLNAVASEKVES